MSLIITKNFKRAKAQDSAAKDAKFKKGDKVVSVKTGAQGVVNEVYGEEKYAVLFNGAANPDRVEGFQIRLANSRATDSCAMDAKFKVGDKVRVLRGRDKGKVGFISQLPRNGPDWREDQVNKYAMVYSPTGDIVGTTYFRLEDLAIVNSRAADSCAMDANFKVGDKVRRGKQTGIVRGIEKEPYIEVKFTDQPVTVFVHESEIVADNSRAADACGTDAKFQKGDKVRVWQYPVYGKLGEVVEATNGSMEYTVNVEGKDYPRIDYRRIVKV